MLGLKLACFNPNIRFQEAVSDRLSKIHHQTRPTKNWKLMQDCIMALEERTSAPIALRCLPVHTAQQDIM